MAKFKVKNAAVSSDSSVNAPTFRFMPFEPNKRLENNSTNIDFITDGKSLYVCAIDGGVTKNTIGESSNVLLKIVSQGERGRDGDPGRDGAAGAVPEIGAEYIDLGGEKKLALTVGGKRKAMTDDLTPPVYVPVLEDDRYLTWEWSNGDPAVIDLMKLRPLHDRPILLRTNSDNTKREAESCGPANFIQWKYEGDEYWTNLISIQELMNLAFAGMATWEASDGKWHLGYREVLKATYDSNKAGRRIINRVELGDVLFDAGELPLNDYEVDIELLYQRLAELEGSVVKSISINNGQKFTPDDDGNVNLPIDLSDYAEKDWVEDNFQPKGHYVEGVQVNDGPVETPDRCGIVRLRIDSGEPSDEYIKKSDLKFKVEDTGNGRYLYVSMDGGNSWTKVEGATCACEQTTFYTVTFNTPSPADAIVKVGNDVKHPGDTMRVPAGETVCVTATAEGYEDFSHCYTINRDTNIAPELTPIPEPEYNAYTINNSGEGTVYMGDSVNPTVARSEMNSLSNGTHVYMKAVRSGYNTITKDGIIQDADLYFTIEANDWVPSVIPVSGVTIAEGDRYTMYVGDEHCFTANVHPANASNQNVYWTLSNSHASVNRSTGCVTAISVTNPTVILTAHTEDGDKQYNCEITILEREEPETTLSVNPTELNFDSDGGSDIITVVTNADDYNVSSGCDWVNVSKSGNVVTVSASENDSEEARSCEITVSAGDKTVIVTVSQDGREPEPEEYDVTIGNTCDADNVYITTIPGASSGDSSLRVEESTIVYLYASKEGKHDIAKSETIRRDYEFTIDCGEWIDIEPEYISVTDVTITNKPESDSFIWNCEDEDIEVGLSIEPSNATNHDQIEWISSDEDVATVSGDINGATITIVGPGNVRISAIGADNRSDSFDLEVELPEVESVELNKSRLVLTEGDSETLLATLYPSCAEGNVSWSSNNTAVATVNNRGIVTAVNPGNAVITASCNGQSDSCDVIVEERIIDVSDISLNKNSLELTYGYCDGSDYGDRHGYINASVIPSNASNQTVNWTISDSSIASISPAASDSGVLTVIARQVGTAVIRATSDDNPSIYAECELTVSAYEFVPDTFILNPSRKELDLAGTDTVQLVPVVTPSCVDLDGIEWSSEDDSVATVDNNGLVTAVAEGETQIIAMLGGRQAQCDIEVVNTYVPCYISAVSLDKQSLDLDLQESDSLTAHISEIGGCTDLDRELTWTSSDPNVASVVPGEDPNTAEVTGLSTGSATITVTTTNGKTATCTVTVNDPTIYVQGISIDECFSALKVGDARAIHATISPSNAYDTGVTYSSSNPSVVEVNASTGVINCVAAGTAVITATSVGTNNAKEHITDQCFITVGERYSISLSKNLFDFSVNLEESTPVIVTAAGGSWTASEACDWISLDSYSGGTGDTQIYITAVPNDTIYDRECYITFTCGDASATFKATQSGADADGSIDISTISCYEQGNIVSNAGCNTSIYVTANAPWKLMVTQNPSQPEEGNVQFMLGLESADNEEVEYPAGTHEVQLYIQPNRSATVDTQERTGVLTLYDSTGEIELAEVSIIQAGLTHRPISVECDAVNFTQGAGGSWSNKQAARILITPGDYDATCIITADLVDSSDNVIRNFLSSETVNIHGGDDVWAWGGPSSDKFYDENEWESSWEGATTYNGADVDDGYRFRVYIISGGNVLVNSAIDYSVYPK